MAFEGALKFAAEHPGRTILGAMAVGGTVAIAPHLAPPIAAKIGLSLGSAKVIGGTIGIGGFVAPAIGQLVH